MEFPRSHDSGSIIQVVGDASSGDEALREGYHFLERGGSTCNYRDFENSILAFKRALRSGRYVSEAKQGLAKARYAYAVEAMFRKDYELALEQLKPLQGTSKEASSLRYRIYDMMARDNISLRKYRVPIFLFFMAIALGIAAYFLHPYLEELKEKNNPVSMMMETVDRRIETRTEINVQIYFFAVYTDIAVRRHDLERFNHYEAVLARLLAGFRKFEDVRGGKKKVRDEAFRFLAEGLPLFVSFREELQEEEKDAGNRNSVLEKRLGDLIDSLHDYRLQKIHNPVKEE